MCFTSFYQDCLEISIGLFYTVPVLVLMRNHVHLVLEPTPHGGKLSEIMKGINLSYAQYFKSKYNRVGHFGRTGFRHNFPFQGNWRGKEYHTKQVEVYAVQDQENWIIITVITKYF